MRYFYIADNKGRDATVMAFSVKSLPNPELGHKGKKIKNVRILESSEQKTYKNLKKEHFYSFLLKVNKSQKHFFFVLNLPKKMNKNIGF